MRTLKITLSLVLVTLFVVTTWVSTSIAGSGFVLIPTVTLDPTATGFPCDIPGFYYAELRISFVPDGNDEASGYDWLALVARRSNGSILSIEYDEFLTDTIPLIKWVNFSLGEPFFGRAQLEIYDITYVPANPNWPVPLSDFDLIRANAPTPVIRAWSNSADLLDPNCPQSSLSGEELATPLPPDERLNWQQGDLMAVVYAASDSSGAPAMHVYTVNDDSRGTFLTSVTQADLAPYRDTPPPAANTVIKTLGENVTLYRLISGEFALVIGPDKEGKNWQIIFDDIPWTYLKHEDFDPGA